MDALVSQAQSENTTKMIKSNTGLITLPREYHCLPSHGIHTGTFQCISRLFPRIAQTPIIQTSVHTYVVESSPQGNCRFGVARTDIHYGLEGLICISCCDRLSKSRWTRSSDTEFSGRSIGPLSSASSGSSRPVLLPQHAAMN